jgi:hypothetical protein
MPSATTLGIQSHPHHHPTQGDPMPENTNGCGNTVHCDDTHNGKRCTITFICNTHATGYHVANYGDQVRTHSTAR